MRITNTCKYYHKCASLHRNYQILYLSCSCFLSISDAYGLSLAISFLASSSHWLKRSELASTRCLKSSNLAWRSCKLNVSTFIFMSIALWLHTLYTYSTVYFFTIKKHEWLSVYRPLFCPSVLHSLQTANSCRKCTLKSIVTTCHISLVFNTVLFGRSSKFRSSELTYFHISNCHQSSQFIHNYLTTITITVLSNTNINKIIFWSGLFNTVTFTNYLISG